MSVNNPHYWNLIKRILCLYTCQEQRPPGFVGHICAAAAVTVRHLLDAVIIEEGRGQGCQTTAACRRVSPLFYRLQQSCNTGV